MTLTRLKYLMLLAVGLLAAGPASAATLTVYATMSGSQMPATDPLFAIGTVTGGAIVCPTNYTAGMAGKVCVADLTGTVVLTAAAQQNAAFTGWSSCPAVSTVTIANDTCTLDLATAQTVQAMFKPALYPLVLKTYGPTGFIGWLTTDGLVTTPAADCGSAGHAACALKAVNGTSVVVTALPGASYKVATWTGCTSSTATTCTVALGSPKGISATFGTVNIPVTAQVQGPGSISSTGGLANLSCTSAGGAGCTAQVLSGGSITLTATAVAGTSFRGWTGACTGTATTCALSGITSAKAVTATFESAICSNCHNVPHGSVASAQSNCGLCHTGYSGNAVNAATHMVDVPGSVAGHVPATTIAAHDGFDVTVLREGTILRAATDTAGKSVVRVQVKDNDGNCVDMGAYWTQNQVRKGWTATGSSAAPRIAIIRLNADFSVLPADQMLGSSSETTTATSWVAADTAACTYDVKLTRALIPTFSQSETYRVAFIGGRWGGSDHNTLTPANPTLDLRQDAGTPLVSHDIVSEAACAACHGASLKLGIHGDLRISPRNCMACHTYTQGGTTNSTNMSFQNMVHRLHSGLEIKTNGFAGIKMAPSHKLYFEGGESISGTAPLLAVIDPELTIDCGVCHTGADAGVWYSKPTRFACGSCHGTVDFATGVNHGPGIPQANDADCSVCHPASGAIAGNVIFPVQKVHGRFFEPAHKFDFTALTPPIPADGHQFKVTLVDVTADATGKPTFTVDVSLDGLPFDIKGVLTTPSFAAGRVGTCAFMVAGPTTDYVIPAAGGTAQSCTNAAYWTFVSSSASSSRFTFSTGTFFAGVPSGYYTAAFEIMWQRVGIATNGDYIRKPFSADPNFLTVKRADDKTALTVTGAEQALNARRNVVEFGKCNTCHEDIGFHSNRGRKGPDYCATCHNPKLDNATRSRATTADLKAYPGFTGSYFLPESVSLNVFIHRVHMGGDLPSVAAKEIAGYGSTGAAAVASPWVPLPGKIQFGALRGAAAYYNPLAGEVSDFSGFGMPNPMQRCDQCHISSGAKQTWALNENPGLAPIERTLKACASTVVSPIDGLNWCQVSGSTGMLPLAGGKVVTPPLKAVCTSCHDSAATDAHADMFTTSPMTAGATELCAGCHGAGKTFDSIVVHQPLP
jgi:OmcA/MtrC family decaheme c-type cytochrome